MEKLIQEYVLEGSFNFRDMGGYPTENGRSVKSGMLYRSGNINKLTEKDLELVKNLGIKKILDLRGLDEIDRFPDPSIEHAVWYHTPIISDDMLIDQVGEQTAFGDLLRNTKPGELLLTLNRNMVSYKKSFQKVFQLLLDEPDKPSLFHCMAGKDRTGVVSALILSVLGVSRELIIKDYLYTNQTLEKMAENFNEIGYNNLPDIEQDVLDALFEARVEYLQAFFEEMEMNYGSMDQYSKEVLGLTNEDIHKLKTHLLV
ncbi:tyrosine-protein phosphatase [Ornithinibacillus xuwenensis]|uniref:Tyrosine-protein phosphatase n=1 Tax=Ornithinibacillus xuwenensis TaxID=3144668 RepID=A0ABU9XGP5_9BACI